MIALAVHEVEIVALIGNLATNIGRAVAGGAAHEPWVAKPMLKAAALRMHELASALPDAPPVPNAPNPPEEQPQAASPPQQQPEGDTTAAPAPAPAGAAESQPAAAPQPAEVAPSVAPEQAQAESTGAPETHTSA